MANWKGILVVVLYCDSLENKRIIDYRCIIDIDYNAGREGNSSCGIACGFVVHSG